MPTAKIVKKFIKCKLLKLPRLRIMDELRVPRNPEERGT